MSLIHSMERYKRRTSPLLRMAVDMCEREREAGYVVVVVEKEGYTATKIINDYI